VKLRANKKTLILFAISIIILVGATIVFSKMHNTFEFKERINDVTSLNQYILSHRPLKLFDLNIEKKNLKKIVFEDSTIEKPQWREIKIQNSKLINTQIVNGTLENIDFSHSKLTNVFFKNVAFDKVLFDYCTFNSVKFINCTFKTVSFYQITSSDINFDKTDMNDGDFRQAEVNLNIKDSKFNDIDFSDLKGSTFIMQNGELKDSTFDSAHLDNFKLDGVKTKDVGLNETQVTSVTLENSELDFGMDYAKAQNIHISNNRINDFGATDGTYENISIHNCKNAGGMGFGGSKIQKLTIENCSTKDFDFYDAKIDKFLLKNFSFHGSLSSKVMINSATLDNIYMSGNINLNGTTIKNLYVHDFHYNPNAKVKTDGSNLEYNAHGLRLKGVWPEVTPDKWLIFHWRKWPIN
jgi:fluoroquinolone resistance protein